MRQRRIWDGVVLSAAALLIGCYSFFVSRYRILWSDELFGWLLVSDPSWRHMFHAWNLGADGGGAGFYVLCRLWLMAFGRSLVAFRAFSAFWVFIGFLCMWRLLRRYYRPLAVGFALPVVWFGSPVLLWHVVQTRFYGLLVGACALHLLVMTECAEELDVTGTVNVPMLFKIFASGLLLVSSHPFGFFYALLILCCTGKQFWSHRRSHKGLLLALAIPWAVLPLSHTALQNSRRVGKPWFWTTKPGLAELHAAYRPTYRVFLSVLACLLTIALIRIVQSRRWTALWASWQNRAQLLAAGVLFLLAPFVFWSLSLRGTSYFVDRYFCPYLIGVAILGTELMQEIVPERLSLSRPMPAFAMAALVVFLVQGVVLRTMVPFEQSLQIPGQDFTGALAAQLPPQLPVVFERADMFDLMAFYRGREAVRPMYVVDWPLALSAESPRWMVSANREMENLKLSGFYADHIDDSEHFLRNCTHFAVVGDKSTPWFQERVHMDPQWHVRRMGQFVQGMWTSDVWDVSR